MPFRKVVSNSVLAGISVTLNTPFSLGMALVYGCIPLFSIDTGSRFARLFNDVLVNCMIFGGPADGPWGGSDCGSSREAAFDVAFCAVVVSLKRYSPKNVFAPAIGIGAGP